MHGRRRRRVYADESLLTRVTMQGPLGYVILADRAGSPLCVGRPEWRTHSCACGDCYARDHVDSIAIKRAIVVSVFFCSFLCLLLVCLLVLLVSSSSSSNNKDSTSATRFAKLNLTWLTLRYVSIITTKFTLG